MWIYLFVDQVVKWCQSSDYHPLDTQLGKGVLQLAALCLCHVTKRASHVDKEVIAVDVFFNECVFKYASGKGSETKGVVLVFD